jgi:integrase
MSYAEQVGLRSEGSNPCRGLRLYREGTRERFLSEVEFREAATAIAATEKSGKIGPHAAAGLRLALFTGARQGELLSAKWSHVDWDRRIIRLPDSKTNEPRTIHLSEAALEVLRGITHIGPYIIAGALEGEAYRSLSRAWAECRGAAGLSDVRLHDLRHSYASLAAAQGVSLQMIGKLLGHKVHATTMRYAHLARDAAADVNDQLGVAMTAAIEKGSQPSADVVKFKRRKRAKSQ